MHDEPFDPSVMARELFEFLGARYRARCSWYYRSDGRPCVVLEESSGDEVVVTIERRERGADGIETV